MLERPPGRRLNDDFYAQVADVYRRVAGRQKNPRTVIAEAAGVSTDVAGRWVYEAPEARPPRRDDPGEGDRLMASAWVSRYTTKDGTPRWRVSYRPGGRETSARHAGSFATQREARLRRDWVAGELAVMRIPIFGSSQPPRPRRHCASRRHGGRRAGSTSRPGRCRRTQWR